MYYFKTSFPLVIPILLHLLGGGIILFISFYFKSFFPVVLLFFLINLYFFLFIDIPPRGGPGRCAVVYVGLPQPPVPGGPHSLGTYVHINDPPPPPIRSPTSYLGCVKKNLQSLAISNTDLVSLFVYLLSQDTIYNDNHLCQRYVIYIIKDSFV